MMGDFIANNPEIVANFLIVVGSLLTGVLASLFGLRVGPDRWLLYVSKANDVVEALSEVLDKVEEGSDGETK